MYIAVFVIVISPWEAVAAGKSRNVHEAFKSETEALTHETEARHRGASRYPRDQGAEATSLATGIRCTSALTSVLNLSSHSSTPAFCQKVIV